MLSSPMGVCALRISRLRANGTPDYQNTKGGFVLCGGISTFAHDFEIEKGPDIYREDACGNACIVRKYPDRVKRATFTLTLCKDDYRIAEILGTADAISSGGTVVGKAVMAAAGCAAPANPNGVAIELWSELWDCDAQAAVPYMRSVLGRAYLTPKGYTKQAGESLPVYEGYATSNPNFGHGPFSDLNLLVGMKPWLMVELNDTALPTCASPIDYVALGTS